MVITWNLVLLSLHIFTDHLSQADEGYPRVIGSIQPVYATLGQDTVLPCHLEPSLNAEWLTIEWSKPDLQPNLSDPWSHIEYVHVYRGQREVQDMMIRSYIRRTTLFKDELKHGNVSLKITNVTVEDEGRYKCFIPKLDGQEKESIIQLIVESNSHKPTEEPVHTRTPQTVDPFRETNAKGGRSRRGVLISAGLLFLVLGGCFFLKLSKSQKETERNLETICVKTADDPPERVNKYTQLHHDGPRC